MSRFTDEIDRLFEELVHEVWLVVLWVPWSGVPIEFVPANDRMLAVIEPILLDLGVFVFAFGIAGLRLVRTPLPKPENPSGLEMACSDGEQRLCEAVDCRRTTGQPRQRRRQLKGAIASSIANG